MHTNRQVGWSGWLLLIALGATVLAFMGLSLAITTTGTARFAVAMGYSEMTGYAVGGVFDFAKAVLPVALLALLAKRGVGPSALLGIAWLGLVTYSALATHATVRTAIDSIERNGTWKTQTRSGVTAELTLIEQRLAALSGSAPPRPSNSLREALEAGPLPAA